ncbi:large conductance mechanosensitive channel protein MscL [Macrococcoides bohemicum]|uniref:Large-conductance mechanosensitive channel n=1 Tax=Macrococcoides bohemicum TaxID=1903056 RepID=A0A328A7Y6_9STAP|nr:MULTISPECIES: large conductance mechanosensitive channel protein MscL [Macrococcus]ATD30447.1 mechanosensitive ion channel protein MscL [Macrococcus sp. IME1552]MBC9873498.1 large conductance mechanosensitive channel protein MscL [Macrococcus bohemicus]QRN49822.1 large conductance mechanosensitive channel protein MscL [Macrococcus bohemicus]QYA41291.1 large conductance mechanosensitive channel protein MscL [Macrococcus bohemicus]QYA43722.1 large conductance mechanosensitive channel protein 
MSLIKEFKEFAIKGNVLDLAVAVVIGAAFGKIVSSLVADVIMPIIGLIFGDTDFASNWAYKGIKYGVFIQSIVDFLIVAAAIFLFVKLINKLTRKNDVEEVEEAVEENTVLLTEIRDLLRSK